MGVEGCCEDAKDDIAEVTATRMCYVSMLLLLLSELDPCWSSSDSLGRA